MTKLDQEAWDSPMELPQTLRVAQEISQVSFILTRRTQMLDKGKQANSSTDASKAGFLKNHIAINASIYQILEGQMDHTLQTLQQQSEWEEPRRPYASTVSIAHTHTHPFWWPELIYSYREEKKKKKRWGGGGNPWSGRENLKLTSFCQWGNEDPRENSIEVT